MLQLSTLKRRLVTLLEEFKRARQFWSDLNDEGLTLANTLVNTKLQERLTDNPPEWAPESNDVTRLNDGQSILDDKIIALKESLQQIVEKMAKQLTKMKMQILQMEFLLEEACESMGDEIVYNNPLYLSCSLETFVEFSVIIFNMFTQEMDLKQKIILSLELELENQQFMVILSTWLNQPYIDFDKIMEFENICKIEIENKEN
ncbi:2344_t:CDS:2 [Racocetra persica]|uniref:2344_t:CDS:1 n=1 Tax=Racocetra persica TaxID=160502 RepID=A0ACA9N7R0_9GLOM|nr:2344_t:CDS:2 [Racocetra persica]